MNRAPDPRSAEGEPENIQIRSRCHRKHLRRTQKRERTRCTLEETSTGTHHLRHDTRHLLRPLAVVVQSETPDPMGLAESVSTTTRSLRGIGTRSLRRNLVGAGMKNASRSPADTGTTEATAIMGKVATEAGVSSATGVANPKAEAKGHTGPLANLPPHHPVEEAEAGDLALARSPPAPAHATQGNVSTSTDLNTLAQNALAG